MLPLRYRTRINPFHIAARRLLSVQRLRVHVLLSDFAVWLRPPVVHRCREIGWRVTSSPAHEITSQRCAHESAEQARRANSRFVGFLCACSPLAMYERFEGLPGPWTTYEASSMENLLEMVTQWKTV